MQNNIKLGVVKMNIDEMPEKIRDEIMACKGTIDLNLISKEAREYIEKHNPKISEFSLPNLISNRQMLKEGVDHIEILLTALMKWTNELEGPFKDEKSKPEITRLYNKCAEVCRAYNGLDIS